MNDCREDFWNALDELVNSSEIVIDRPKGSAHPRFPSFIYRVDYGYLKSTTSMDGAGIDVWVGSGDRKIDAIMCIVDLMKKDSDNNYILSILYSDKYSSDFINHFIESYKLILKCMVNVSNLSDISYISSRDLVVLDEINETSHDLYYFDI